MSTGYEFKLRTFVDTAVDLWMSDRKAFAISVYGEINTWDVSRITDFSFLFSTTRNSSAASFNSDISNWDVSSGTDFQYMFYRTYEFDQDIGSWDVSSGNNFFGMLGVANSFNKNISSWDVSSGTDFGHMFNTAKRFNQDLVNWNVSSGNGFSGMFAGADLMNANGWSYNPSSSDFLGQTLTGDSNAETITGATGNDVLSGLGGNDAISGGDGWDKLFGGDGDDILDGGIKDDSMSGGTGNDTYVVDSTSDTVTESSSAGTDLIQSSVTYTASNNVENLTLTGSSNINATGNILDNLLTGNSGNNTIDGVSGTDTFIFSSNRKDYKITYFSSYLKIEDLRSGSPDGTDNLYSIEKLQFSGRTYSTSDLFFNPDNHSIGNNYILVGIRDYDGNLHANTGSVSDDTKTSYKYQGLIDVNADGTKEAIYTNKESGRWVTGKIDTITGEIDYSDHGAGGGTRVVGIYIDPLVTSGDVVQGSDHDSQRRFQNDLEIDNLIAKTSGDYDSDGFQEVYWKTNDGTAYLRSLMHADGNIQYANYQNEEQMIDYLTSNGNDGVIGDII